MSCYGQGKRGFVRRLALDLRSYGVIQSCSPNYSARLGMGRNRPPPSYSLPLLAALAIGALVSLAPARAIADPIEAGRLASYRALRPVAGDSHRHSGVAYSLLAMEAHEIDPNSPCPHEFGAPMAIYDAARKGGYEWLSLAHHIGPPGLVKPDRTPHHLVESPDDPAYAWWIDPKREAAVDSSRDGGFAPNPGGFPDYGSGTAGQRVDPPHSEPLSLASAARASTRNDEFVAFSGREFTTAVFWPRSGRAREGGHKILLFPVQPRTSCGARARNRDASCASASHIYRWVERRAGIVIQAHPAIHSDAPGKQPQWVPHHPQKAPGGFSDAHVQGLEVGSHERFEPRWEAQYQKLLSLGAHVFPAFGSDRHTLDIDSPQCFDNGPPNVGFGATVCWAEKLTPHGITDAMRAGRCYYANGYRPRLEVELSHGRSKPGSAVAMGGTLSVDGHEPFLRVEVHNDPRSHEAPYRTLRFERLEIIHVTPDEVKVIASCDSAGFEGAKGTEATEGVTSCFCRSGTVAPPNTVPDHCAFEGQVEVSSGAIYPRVIGREVRPRCKAKPNRPCEGTTTVVVGAPIHVQ